jgi:hypothetical protein
MLVKSIEAWFVDNIPEEVELVFKLKDLIANFNRSKQLKLTDFFAKKK